MLVSYKADVNAQNSYHGLYSFEGFFFYLYFKATPLMLAIADGKLSIIQYLLKNGADTEITDYRQGSIFSSTKENMSSQMNLKCKLY